MVVLWGAEYLGGMERVSTIKDGRELRILRVQPEDAADILVYTERVSGESDFLSFGPGEFGISLEEETKFIRSLDGGRLGFLLKGVVGGEIVSVCALMRPPRPRLKHNGRFGISVAASCWGLGVGRAMCLATLDAAREVGVTKVDLHVREDNAKAIALYESVGFQREGLSVQGFRIGGKYFADVVMGVCLPES
jgi:RimJ/RimL family protein N-acetyltransferase